MSAINLSRVLPESAVGVACAFSCRSNGNMSLCYGDTQNALKNRQDFLSGLKIDYRNLVCAKQIHGGNVKYAKEKDLGKGALTYDDSVPDTDAFITDRKNLPLAVFTADCLPVFLYDPATPSVGVVHASWRSSKECISAKTIKLMQEEFKTNTSDLLVGFGPAIRSCCYDVEEDFRDYFGVGLKKRDGRYYLDLLEINARQLLDSGVSGENIFDSGICTVCRNKDFFSYRKEKEASGRMISVIMLR